MDPVIAPSRRLASTEATAHCRPSRQPAAIQGMQRANQDQWVGGRRPRERHIADIRLENELVIEFQHASLAPEERAKRETFYQKMVWVVDGGRLKRDWPRFQKAINNLNQIGKGIYLPEIPEEHFPNTWITSRVPVLFDFSEADTPTDPTIPLKEYLLMIGNEME